MLSGFSLTDESTLTDAKAAKAAGIAFAGIRVRKVGKDDQKASQHRAALLAAGIPFWCFADLDYRSGAQGRAQAVDFTNMLSGSSLPPIIRLWPIDNLPVTDWAAFAKLLAEVVYYMGHNKPMIAANLGTMRSIIGVLPSLSLDQKTMLMDCQWTPIAWTSAAPTLPSPFTKYPFWEKNSYTVNVAGAASVAQVEWPGNMDQLIAWSKNPTLDNIPAWDQTPPPPPPPDDGGTPPPPPPDTGGSVDLTAVVAHLASIDNSLVQIAGELTTFNDALKAALAAFAEKL